MIIDTLINAHKYYGLHKNFQKGFDFIQTLEPGSLHPEKYTLEGIDLHATVSIKNGVKAVDAKFEAHNSYIDIQFCPEGYETFGWKPRNKCHAPNIEYNEQKDVIFYNDQPDMYFQLHAGQFAIFYPDDVHAPMIGDGPIKKVVVKVKIL